MLNIVQTPPECKTAIDACIEIEDHVRHVDGVFETIFILDEKILTEEPDSKRLAALENARFLLFRLLQKNHEELLDVIESARRKAVQGAAA